MPKYSKRLAHRICQLIETDSYTIAEVCSIVRISERCYYDWQANKAEFAEKILEARFKFDEMLVAEAKKSLRKKVSGYTIQEKQTVYVDAKDKDGTPKPRIKEQKVIDKHFQPDTEAIKFVLTNKAPNEYKNKQDIEATIERPKVPTIVFKDTETNDGDNDK